MDQGDFAVNQAANEYVFGISHRLKDSPDLMAFRVRPPTPFDGFAGNFFGKARNWAAG